MVLDTAESLLDAIRETRLLDEQQLGALLPLLDKLSTSRDLGRVLIQKGFLTAFQVNQLLQGRGKRLVLGPYLLLERLGAGGMGEVFKACHLRLKRLAAVKVINQDRLNHPNAVQRFLREAESAAKLSHPNIVAVYDAGEQDGTHFIAMEFIDGIDLGRLVQLAGLLPVGQACDAIRQACLGLHHAHAAGFVHRDIKPANLLVAPHTPRPEKIPFGDPSRLLACFAGGTVKVLDMGLVYLESERLQASDAGLTQKGVVIGTIDYLAPEQAKHSRRVDRRADLYSLGCTLFHLLAGQVPFPEGLPLDKLLKHQLDAPPRLRTLRPDVPLALENIIVRLMAKRPDDRFQSAAELAEVLAPFATSAQSFSPLPPSPGLGEDFSSIPDTEFPPSRFEQLAPTRLVAPPPIPPTEAAFNLDGSKRTLAPPPLPPTLAEPFPPRGGTERWWWLLGGVVAVVVVLFFLGKVLSPKEQTIDEEVELVHPLILPTYIPAETALVIGIDFQQWHKSPLLTDEKNRNSPLPANFQGLLHLLGMDAEQDLETARLMIPTGAFDRSLILAKGRFDKDNFLTGPRGLHKQTEGNGRLYRHVSADRKKDPLYVAFESPYFLMGGNREAVLGGLSDTQSPVIRNEDARAALEAVDRSQMLWIAGTLTDLGTLPKLPDATMERALRSILKGTKRLVGGIARTKTNLTMKFSFQTASEAEALELAKHLKEQQDNFNLVLAFTPAKNKPARLWLRLFGKAKLERKGIVVTLHHQIPAGNEP